MRIDVPDKVGSWSLIEHKHNYIHGTEELSYRLEWSARVSLRVAQKQDLFLGNKILIDIPNNEYCGFRAVIEESNYGTQKYRCVVKRTYSIKNMMPEETVKNTLDLIVDEFFYLFSQRGIQINIAALRESIRKAEFTQ